MKFLPTEEVFDPYTGDRMPQHPRQHPITYPIPQSKQHSKPRSNARGYKGRSRPWICHHCGIKGHIRPYCFKLYGYPKWYHQPDPVPDIPTVKKEWKAKLEETTLIEKTGILTVGALDT
jgi:hypothetical protein